VDPQQVVDFFHTHSGIEEVEVQSETDRYIVWPGQALGYKVGQLKILELRDYAKASSAPSSTSAASMMKCWAPAPCPWM